MTVQNYVGLDARIESVVWALMGGIDVDLSDFYTKEEMDALIALLEERRWYWIFDNSEFCVQSHK